MEFHIQNAFITRVAKHPLYENNQLTLCNNSVNETHRKSEEDEVPQVLHLQKLTTTLFA